jgi:hypothetical protein
VSHFVRPLKVSYYKEGPEIEKQVVSFVWIKACQLTFEELTKCLASVPILVRPDFTKLSILEVDYSTKGVGAVLCQKDGRKVVFVAYASKGLSKSQKNYHPMEGECSALIWVVMHLR